MNADDIPTPGITWANMDAKDKEAIEAMADESIESGEPVIRVVGKTKVVVFTQAWYDTHQEPGDEPLKPAMVTADSGIPIYVYKIPGEFGMGKMLGGSV